MSDDRGSSPDFNASAPMRISNGVLLSSLIFLFLVVVFVFLLYLYAKRYMRTSHLLNSREPHFTFVTGNLPAVRRGLDSATLRSLPVTVFDVKECKEGLECSVCLSEVAHGEEVRILPKCNHGFHVNCIDMWFHSHSTCPLCRSPVSTDLVPAQEPNAESVQAQSLDAVSREGYVNEPRALPTNVLFWGNQDDVTTAGAVPEATSSSNSTSSRKREGGTGTLVIDIPRRAMENVVLSPMSPLPPSVMAREELKSPVSARFRSLKRLLSRGKQVVGPSGSPRGGDIEQGIVQTPKTPRFQG